MFLLQFGPKGAHGQTCQRIHINILRQIEGRRSDHLLFLKSALLHNIFIDILRLSHYPQIVVIKMQTECTICRVEYNISDRYPIEICSKKHICCNQCFDSIHQIQSICPFCRQAIQEYSLFQLKSHSQQRFRIAKAQDISKRFNQQLNNYLPNPTRLQINSAVWKRYKEIRQEHDCPTAILFLKLQIELEPNMDDDTFIGLGSVHEQEGFSEKCGYEWYENRYKLAQLSLYDQLAVAIAVDSPAKDQELSWYRKIMVKNPANYKIIYQQALNFSFNRFQELILAKYKTIIKLKPDFDKPYETIAFFHLWKNNPALAKQFANQCIKRNPRNFFAEYILAVSDKDLCSSQVQQKLLKVIEREPTYVRALYSYGKELSKAKMHKKALQCFEKCLEINPHYLCPLINKAMTLIDLSKHQAGIYLVHKSLNEQKYSHLWSNHNFSLSTSFQIIGNQKKAQFYDKFSFYLTQEQRSKLGNIYYWANDWRIAIKYFAYNNAVEINSNDVISKITSCYEHLKMRTDEIKWLHKLHSRQTSNVMVLQRLANSYQNDQCYDGAIYWTMKCLEQRRNVQRLHRKLINLFHQNGQYRQSLQEAEKHRMAFELSSLEIEELLNHDMKNYYQLKKLKQEENGKVSARLV